MDVNEILRRVEGKTLEFKRDLSSREGFLRTVVAFANTAGGTIVIGVEDETKRVLGVAEPLALEERVANMISDSVTPRLVPDIELSCYRDQYLLGVTVYPSSQRPHWLGREVETGAYVRVGSTNRLAGPELIAEMRRFARGETFDEGPMPELDSEAMDFRAASELFSEFRKLVPSDLEVLGLCARHQGRVVPTVGGVLLFGHDRLRHFPDAWIQGGRFGGADRSVILDRAELRMPLAEVISPAMAFVERHMASGVAIEGVRRVPQWTLPPVAVREALVNAVAHADYSQRGAPLRIAVYDDRLEVENPGLLPFGLTLDDLPHGVSKLRNRVIGRVFHELGLVEQWGSGVQRMIAACRDAGLAAPKWEEVGDRLRVTLWTERVEEVRLDATDQAIVESLSERGRTTGEIAGAIGLSSRATRTRLARLVERGLVAEVGGPRDPKRTYHLVRRRG